jgi:hypothetical protein
VTRYRTDQDKLDFLAKRIERLEKTLERLETLGMTSLSTAGNSKSFRMQEDIRRELERAEQEWDIINARLQGEPIDPTFKRTIVVTSKL